ncbi:MULTISPECIES: response regulator transcription factor [Corynebacterium]|uniref:DNA-binding response OmpR family regulator n=1 Tax=Corynebacterium freneyi TaxID=134034 RepID=A0ABS4U4Z5_9CORY|nr:MULTISPECIES: response regulator transcription factor [Corynebacterium]MBP2331723.1 DNA-binding response OmpR family regulator [Corynebacterium freneyi]OFU52920.1 transcriptional regulator [Corynebacterium sp. HMSC11E11]UBI02027.1 response regulator transcription factor [Corynebacterium freneyi]WJZ06154.1 Transcriptional regulatory protein YycF [Corynebacterium freneyi]
MRLAIVSNDPGVRERVPNLGLLNHDIIRMPATEESATLLEDVTVAIIDATGPDLVAARGLCRHIAGANPDLPVAVLAADTALIAIDGSWAVDDFLLPSATPAEIDARLRLLLSRHPVPVTEPEESPVLTLGDLVVDEHTYTARLNGEPMNLTFKEFELLRFLTRNAGRVYTREQLLQDVWGYDYYGGTRTVDVHVRRLRAKLGHRHEGLIATVRNVGYKAVEPEEDQP